MHKRHLRILAVLGAILVAGCQTWAQTEFKATAQPASAQATSAAGSANTGSSTANRSPRSPGQVILTTQDITDRPYQVISDIEVTVNKATVFHANPTPALADIKLREEAAKVGADAVIKVQYSDVHVSFLSWGSLDAKGQAVAFVK